MAHFEPDPDVIALGVRQPWVELILRGIKTIEVRSTDTQVRGTIYLYSSRKFSEIPAAQAASQRHALERETLPYGLLVGSAEICGTRRAVASDAIAACVPASVLKNQFVWELTKPQRFKLPLPVRFLPYGVWFYPFQRKTQPEQAGEDVTRRPARRGG